MHKRFQAASEYGQRMEGDGQVENNSHLSTSSYDQPQPINGLHLTKQDLDSKKNYSGHGNNQSRPLYTETEKGSKLQTRSLLPDVAKHFSNFVSYEESNQSVSQENCYINYLSNNSHNVDLKALNWQLTPEKNSFYKNSNILISHDDDDDEMLLSPNSIVDGHSKTGLDNPVALGPDQGYPKNCENTKGSNNIMLRSSSKLQFGRIDQMSSETFMKQADGNIALKDKNQMREVWTKLYGKTASTQEESTMNSNLQSSLQAFSVPNVKSRDNLILHSDTVTTNENLSTKSDVCVIQRRPINGNLQSDKHHAGQNLPSNIIPSTRTKSETSKDEQTEEKLHDKKSLKVNYQPTPMTSSDIVFFDVMNRSSKYNAERGSLHKKDFSVSRNKNIFTNYSPVLCDQIKNQFTENHASNIEGSDQPVLDINDSIFDYSATGSVSDHSLISTSLPVRTTALSSSASSSGGSKSASSDQNEPRLDKTVYSVSLEERKPMHTKMTQITPKSLWQQNRDTTFHVNFNLPNKKIFSSRHSQPNEKDATYTTDDGSMSFDIDDTILTVESIESDSEQLKMKISSQVNSLDDVKEQLDYLTFMYQQLYHSMNQNKKVQNPNDLPWSIDDLKTNSMKKPMHFQRKKSMRSTILETKHNKKHFQRLEAHVVTLVQSVANLTNQVEAHTNALKQIDILKEELQNLKGTLSEANNHNGIFPLPNKLTEYERFRGWIPSLTNPRRVQKLTKFFGHEPPLLEIFLKKLGYERYISNFSTEHIGMLELPYMTEERLQSIGIPMGPRLRILQESQLCFRQENFNIYII